MHKWIRSRHGCRPGNGTDVADGDDDDGLHELVTFKFDLPPVFIGDAARLGDIETVAGEQ